MYIMIEFMGWDDGRRHLNLYSTAMQNHSRWVLVLGVTPNVTILRWVNQHVGI